MFAVVRHPDIEALGIVPDGALKSPQAKGFYRVSDWRAAPADFHLPEFADSFDDLDAPPAEPETEEPVATEDDEEQES